MKRPSYRVLASTIAVAFAAVIIAGQWVAVTVMGLLTLCLLVIVAVADYRQKHDPDLKERETDEHRDRNTGQRQRTVPVRTRH